MLLATFEFFLTKGKSPSKHDKVTVKYKWLLYDQTTNQESNISEYFVVEAVFWGLIFKLLVRWSFGSFRCSYKLQGSDLNTFTLVKILAQKIWNSFSLNQIVLATKRNLYRLWTKKAICKVLFLSKITRVTGNKRDWKGTFGNTLNELKTESKQDYFWVSKYLESILTL